MTVTTIPDVQITATSDAAGEYALDQVPTGVYSLKFSGAGYATLQVDGVSVIATKTAKVDKVLTATNPLVLTPLAATAPAGFNAPAKLGVTVAGGTAPYTYSWVAAAANPTKVTLSSATDPAPTFTTGKLADVIAGGKAIGFAKVTEFDATGQKSVADPQIGFLGISAQQLAQMTYNFTVTVTDATGFVKTATVAVPPATLAQGNQVVPVGQTVVANLPGNTAAATLAGPAGSGAVLNDAATSNPWFVPDVKGIYTLTAGTTKLVLDASKYTSANKDCANCHRFIGDAKRKNVDAKFKDWANSAHGNHFFKYMHYDASGNLVWNKGADGKPVQAPTANPSVFWASPGPMTTFQFGMMGAEGTHYSKSCTACHTTGFNALASNNGADDVMAAAPWVFPDLTAAFPNLVGDKSRQVVVDGVVGTVTYDQVTAAPSTAAWSGIPDSVKAFAGMQCESCHGPLGGHVTIDVWNQSDPSNTIVRPVQEFSVDACAVCHDKPGNHDRVSLWRQSGHANLEVALSEGAGVSSTPGAAASPSASCNRCHSAQGFVQYLHQLTGKLAKPDGTPIAGTYPGNVVDPSTSPLADAKAPYLQSLGITADAVQPQTCAACHDPHTTGLRVEGDTPMLASGFEVKGAGAGALCFVCHNSRNGARGDALKGVYGNNANPGSPAKVTAIGAPHESSQGDVLAGRNAFFVKANSPSAHLSVADTCVGCHMKNFPAGLTGTNTNHTWRIDTSICGSCHGGSKAPVNGEALQGQFDSAVTELQAALDDAATHAAPGLYYKGSKQTVWIPSGTTATFTTGRSIGLSLTFPAAVNDPNADSGTVTTLKGGLANFYKDAGASTPAFDMLQGTLAKANWNFALVTQDSSRAVHNPRFVFEVLSSTLAAVRASSLPK
ncbi:MAG: carboxypeptidase regulatory-like domain-containing protein [Myxococcales bacterium]